MKVSSNHLKLCIVCLYDISKTQKFYQPENQKWPKNKHPITYTFTCTNFYMVILNITCQFIVGGYKTPELVTKA